MILSARLFEYDELKKKLKKDEKIIVFSCNNCAKKCDGLGGRVGLKALCDKLEADGFNVTRRELCGIACSLDMIEERAQNEATAKVFEQADVIIPLSCEDGEHAIHHVFPHVKIVRVTKTIGIGWASPQEGVRLTDVLAGVPVKVPGPQGITLKQAADQLKLPVGAF
jgi:hypothetical protein